MSRRHIAWGFLARDNDSIKADSPFGLRHIFHRTGVDGITFARIEEHMSAYTCQRHAHRFSTAGLAHDLIGPVLQMLPKVLREKDTREIVGGSPDHVCTLLPSPGASVSTSRA